jgi:hypothetical protein
LDKTTKCPLERDEESVLLLAVPRYQGIAGYTRTIPLYEGHSPDEETEEDTSKEDLSTESLPDGTLTDPITAHPIKTTKSVSDRTQKGTQDRILAGTPRQTQDSTKNLNQFFKLEKSNLSWAERAQKQIQTQISRPSQDSLPTKESPNLLESSNDNDTNDGKDNQPTPEETIRVLRTEVSTLQATIHDIQAWMLTKDNAIQKISQDAKMARESLQQTNIHGR